MSELMQCLFPKQPEADRLMSKLREKIATWPPDLNGVGGGMTSGAQLLMIHDDGEAEITVVVHGLSQPSRFPDYESLQCYVNEAEIRGRVYLYFWESGPVHNFFRCKARADRLGAALYRSLSHVKGIASLPITLIGCSLGAKVVSGFLDSIPKHVFKIRSVVLLGGAADNDEDEWETRAELVYGGIVNVYAGHDRVLHGFCHLIGDPVGLNAIDSSLRKIRNVRWTSRHSDYLPQFDLALFKALSRRRRSADFEGIVEVECPGPDCDQELVVPANIEVYCPECGTDFWYEPKNKKCWRSHPPKYVECDFCDTGIWVQDTALYQCGGCRRWNDWQRIGDDIYDA